MEKGEKKEGTETRGKTSVRAKHHFLARTSISCSRYLKTRWAPSLCARSQSAAATHILKGVLQTWWINSNTTRTLIRLQSRNETF